MPHDIPFAAGRVHLYDVDDGDGSGPEYRCEVKLRSNGEAGSGGQLPRMRADEVEALIAVLQQALQKMRGEPTP